MLIALLTMRLAVPPGTPTTQTDTSYQTQRSDREAQAVYTEERDLTACSASVVEARASPTALAQPPGAV